ncbi:MAG: hypothetical protein QOE93_1055 [Actinomycetota bacterium]|nr:hypothetical protein [Actinomycetota bacterium]
MSRIYPVADERMVEVTVAAPRHRAPGRQRPVMGSQAEPTRTTRAQRMRSYIDPEDADESATYEPPTRTRKVPVPTAATYEPVRSPRFRSSASVPAQSAAIYEPMESARFGGALAFAAIFKVLAVLAVIGGLIATILVGMEVQDTARTLGTHANVGPFFVVGAAGTIVASAFLAFCGYVLEVLVGIYDEV